MVDEMARTAAPLLLLLPPEACSRETRAVNWQNPQIIAGRRSTEIHTFSAGQSNEVRIRIPSAALPYESGIQNTPAPPVIRSKIQTRIQALAIKWAHTVLKHLDVPPAEKWLYKAVQRIPRNRCQKNLKDFKHSCNWAVAKTSRELNCPMKRKYMVWLVWPPIEDPGGFGHFN